MITVFIEVLTISLGLGSDGTSPSFSEGGRVNVRSFVLRSSQYAQVAIYSSVEGLGHDRGESTCYREWATIMYPSPPGQIKFAPLTSFIRRINNSRNKTHTMLRIQVVILQTNHHACEFDAALWFVFFDSTPFCNLTILIAFLDAVIITCML